MKNTYSKSGILLKVQTFWMLGNSKDLKNADGIKVLHKNKLKTLPNLKRLPISRHGGQSEYSVKINPPKSTSTHN